MPEFYAYHAVTERPMSLGQRIVFDGERVSGVYGRVMEKMPLVQEVYAHPERYRAEEMEHHLCVALRELAMEEVRKAEFPQYPSRMASLYVSKTLPEAEQWFAFFRRIGRPTFQIVRVQCDGRCFSGNAELCFQGTPDREENQRLARRYWLNPAVPGETKVTEMLIDGQIEVAEICKQAETAL